MKYSYSCLPGSSGIADFQFRVQDDRDNRIATCYVEANARLIVDQMNRAEELTGELAAAQKEIKRLNDLLTPPVVSGTYRVNAWHKPSMDDVGSDV